MPHIYRVVWYRYILDTLLSKKILLLRTIDYVVRYFYNVTWGHLISGVKLKSWNHHIYWLSSTGELQWSKIIFTMTVDSQSDMRRIVGRVRGYKLRYLDRWTGLMCLYHIRFRTGHYSSTTRDSSPEPAQGRLAYGLRRTWVFWWHQNHPWTWWTERRNGRNELRSCVGISPSILRSVAWVRIAWPDSTNRMGRMIWHLKYM